MEAKFGTRVPSSSVKPDSLGSGGASALRPFHAIAIESAVTGWSDDGSIPTASITRDK